MDMMAMAKALGKIGIFLRNNNADSETLKAFDYVRNTITILASNLYKIVKQFDIEKDNET